MTRTAAAILILLCLWALLGKLAAPLVGFNGRRDGEDVQ